MAAVVNLQIPFVMRWLLIVVGEAYRIKKQYLGVDDRSDS
jgi:hypothetical protein